MVGSRLTLHSRHTKLVAPTGTAKGAFAGFTTGSMN